jgi:radical SAM superfamily enzyme YgiQ (UPF0313 family)
MKMKIVFVNIYPTDTVARYLLSSYLLKGYLIENLPLEYDIEVEIINVGNLLSARSIAKRISNTSPDVIGYSSYVWNINIIYKTIELLKKHGNYINILGGPEISLNVLNLLSNSNIADFYIIGEGEKKFTRLIKAIYDLKSINKVQLPDGVARWNNNECKFDYNESKEQLVLDEIPSVYLNGVIEANLLEAGQVFYETQRGCKYKCKYCTYHKNRDTISFFSLERVCSELKYLICERKISTLRFIDAIFTSDLKRSKEIVDCLLTIKKGGTELPWIYWEFTYNSVDNEFLHKISQLKERSSINNCETTEAKDYPQLYTDLLDGYKAINCVGIQSFNKASLNAVGRPEVFMNLFDEFMNNTRNFNIVLKLDLILGLPYETVDTFFDGLEKILPYLENTDNLLNIHILQVLPESELEHLCDKYNLKYRVSAPHYVFETNTMSKVDIEYCAKCSCLLFRMLNSPLRSKFFDNKRRSNLTCKAILDELYAEINNIQIFKNTVFVQKDFIDDVYWNKDIYYEINNQWLEEYLS